MKFYDVYAGHEPNMAEFQGEFWSIEDAMRKAGLLESAGLGCVVYEIDCDRCKGTMVFKA